MKILVVGDFQGVFPKKMLQKIKREEFDFIIGVGDYGGISDWRPYFIKFFKLIKTKGIYLSAEEYFGRKKYEMLKRKDKEAAKNVLRNLNSLGKEGIFIFGNTDSDWYGYPFDEDFIKMEKGRTKFIRSLRNLHEITYNVKKFKGLEILGFGGYMDPAVNFISEKRSRSKESKARYKNRLLRTRRAERKLMSLVRKMKQKDIFVFHYPPQGVFDIIRDKKNPYDGKSAGVNIFTKAIRKYKPKLVLCGHMHEYQGAKTLGKSLVVNPGDAEVGKYAIVEYPSLKVKFSK